MQTVNKYSNFEHKPYKLSTYYTTNPSILITKLHSKRESFQRSFCLKQVSNKNTPFNVQLHSSEVSFRVTQTEGRSSENWNYHDGYSTTTGAFQPEIIFTVFLKLEQYTLKC